MDTKPSVRADNNQVFLRGRLATEPTSRTMPSGDVLAQFRLTVDRPPGSRARVDSIDCATSRARVRRSIERAQCGDQLEVVGALHRRFWRSPTGLGSRYEVEVSSAKVIARRQSAASPAPTRASA